VNPANSEFAVMLIKQVLAIPRYGTADEVAGMVSYLAGPDVA
jgi:3-oxoacyl-[acyl-carrier protein] reductase